MLRYLSLSDHNAKFYINQIIILMLNFRVLLLSTSKDGNSSINIQALLVFFLCIVVYGYSPWVTKRHN